MKINNFLFDIEWCFLKTDNRRKIHIGNESRLLNCNYERFRFSRNFLRRLRVDGNKKSKNFSLNFIQ